MADQVLQRDTLSTKLREALLQEIRTSDLRPGDRLPAESKLMERYGVGRQVVREALQSLQATGVVEVVNGRGAVVRPLSSDQLQQFFQRAVAHGSEADGIVELMEVRRGVEVQSAGLAAERATARDVSELRDLEQRMREEADPERFASLDVELHLAIAAATGNQLLEFLVEAIRVPIRATVVAGLERQRAGGSRLEIDRLHAGLVDAIAASDAARAERAMAEHFDVAVFALVAGDR